jgi:hypothetical protein
VGGADDIKRHPFFKGVNWKKMEARQVRLLVWSPSFIVLPAAFKLQPGNLKPNGR